ncbi:MAG: AAA family ATPase, partial [Actinobacteria bacterium]|nr:AAA family ATPase [Actinomycetota bacterium]
MHNILKTLFGADAPARAATGPASPAQPIGEPAPASAVGEAFGPLVQCHADRFTINGTGYPRRNLETRARPAFPRDLRTALGGVFADDADAKALVPERSEIFLHITPGMAAILGRIAELEQHPRLKTFVMLTGPTGCGKTTMVKTYCHFANEPCVELTFSGDTTLADFFRRTEVVRAEGGQSTVAALGPAVRAMVFGHKLLINEINMLPPDLLSVLTQAMDTGRLVLAGTDLGNIAIAVHERFGIFATANVNYVGTAEIGRALHRRFGMGLGNIPMTFLPPAEEAAAVAFEFNRTPLFAGLDVHINPSIVDRVVGVANALRDHPDHGGQLRDRISTRSLVHWLTLARTTGLPLAEVAQRAVLATAPDDAYAPALELTRRALGTATASVAYPEAFRRAVLGPDAPPEGAA